MERLRGLAREALPWASLLSSPAKQQLEACNQTCLFMPSKEPVVEPMTWKWKSGCTRTTGYLERSSLRENQMKGVRFSLTAEGSWTRGTDTALPGRASARGLGGSAGVRCRSYTGAVLAVVLTVLPKACMLLLVVIYGDTVTLYLLVEAAT